MSISTSWLGISCKFGWVSFFFVMQGICRKGVSCFKLFISIFLFWLWDPSNSFSQCWLIMPGIPSQYPAEAFFPIAPPSKELRNRRKTRVFRGLTAVTGISLIFQGLESLQRCLIYHLCRWYHTLCTSVMTELAVVFDLESSQGRYR